MAKRTVGVIGGSGLYDLPGLERVEEQRVATPFGAPSDAVVRGWLGDTELLFLPRHGRGHRISPSEINFRANVYALKVLGATHVISISAVGSMREEIQPGDFVVVDQFIDRTKDRPATFFRAEGIVAHVEFADPVCPALAKVLYDASARTGRARQGGTYLCIEGPQFSTRAESRLYRSWDVDVIGMTNLPEAKLAREAELCYATIALATDYDCWHQHETDVTVDAVVAVLQKNAARAREVIRLAAGAIAAERTCRCKDALKTAILTDRSKIPPEAIERLRPIVGRYFP